MKLTQNKTRFHSAIFWNFLTIFSSYRLQMPVAEVMGFPDGNGYYVCPRYHITVEREFMSFCDRCGQHLDWKGYKKAKIVYPGQRNSLHTWLIKTQERRFPPVPVFFIWRLRIFHFIYINLAICPVYCMARNLTWKPINSATFRLVSTITAGISNGINLPSIAVACVITAGRNMVSLVFPHTRIIFFLEPYYPAVLPSYKAGSVIKLGRGSLLHNSSGMQ